MCDNLALTEAEAQYFVQCPEQVFQLYNDDFHHGKFADRAYPSKITKLESYIQTLLTIQGCSVNHTWSESGLKQGQQSMH